MDDETKIENGSKEPTEKERKRSYAVRLTDTEYFALVKETGREKAELLRFVIDDRERLKKKVKENETTIGERDRTLKSAATDILDLKTENNSLQDESSEKDLRIKDAQTEKELLSKKMKEIGAALDEQKRRVNESNKTIEKYEEWNNGVSLKNEHLRISNNYAKSGMVVSLLTLILTIAFAELHIFIILEYVESILILVLAVTVIVSIVSFINSPETWDAFTKHRKE
jgi:chromosome segregation ATPase